MEEGEAWRPARGGLFVIRRFILWLARAEIARLNCELFAARLEQAVAEAAHSLERQASYLSGHADGAHQALDTIEEEAKVRFKETHTSEGVHVVDVIHARRRLLH